MNMNSVKIYTDGSKKDDGVSVGTVCIAPESGLTYKDSINHKVSNFIAECRVLSRTMELTHEYSHCNVDIFTNPLSALKALNAPKVNDKIYH